MMTTNKAPNPTIFSSPKTASCMDLQVQVKPIKPSILPCAPVSLRHMPDWTEKKRVNADAS